ncbi:MAG: MGMT family protein [Candidatus Dojkabacteria bacterium]|uniref:Methylated-DNA--protein-cysteine methyltransferase n=2 Tax=Candidatus Dojkabacteria TaxID=74243 RepID=A0A136KKG9_9BACT|nr:MAG: Methylated-DNA--protein-cysteine methyltransferase [candidate division WS6 bacterium OLB21]MBW7953868.1 MGMT family protein [Candidatus Dojkabacteria bacterium]WKZ27995.1 MAG: MGMT family protein [Candidatus Dojkabacteria bacterium]
MSTASDAVFRSLRLVPKGRVVTYGQLASASGIKSARAVGRILHNNPNIETNPCHRVVFADGSLSESFAFGGFEAQYELLRSEGVFFSKNKVDLKISGYHFREVDGSPLS